ncbi:hypothetical protein [Pararhodonellum marinum]|uniref:hypothetical protein n=1 Tax=Pararhodonellum marinum TaxID=2755358 RepID=UPI00188F823D|nr:hypothetical protein [Pararhodonellum marinum]
MNSEKKKHFFPAILAALLTLLGFGLIYHFQQPLSYELNLLFDGNEYAKAYAYFKGQTPEYTVKYPFNVRILVPWMASKMPFDSVQGDFLAVNLIFSVLFSFCWFFAAPMAGLDRLKTWIAWFWITFHWVGLLKANIMDPINVDVPLYLVQVLLFIAFTKEKWIWLLILAPLGTLQKESMLPTLMLLTLYPGLDKLICGNKKAFGLLVVSVLLSFGAFKWASVYFAEHNGSQNIFLNLITTLAYRVSHPISFLRWMLAVTLAFGPFIWIWLWKVQKGQWKLDPIQKILLPMAPLYVFFSFLAGGDFTRLAFLGSPFLMLLFLRDVEFTGRQWLLVGLLALPAMRLWEWIPDGGKNFEAYSRWYPEFAPWPYLAMYLIYTVMVALVSKIYLNQKPASPLKK